MMIHRTNGEEGGYNAKDMGGDIITEVSYKDFILKFDFRIFKASNSGVKYFVQKGTNTGAGSEIGCEFQVLEYERNNQMWNALVAYSKYKVWPDFGNFESGHILIQDHGDEAWYKNVKIKVLD